MSNKLLFCQGRFYVGAWGLCAPLPLRGLPLHAPLSLKRFLECLLTAPLPLTPFSVRSAPFPLHSGWLALTCAALTHATAKRCQLWRLKPSLSKTATSTVNKTRKRLENANFRQGLFICVRGGRAGNFSRGTMWLGIPKSWHLPWHPHTKFQPAPWAFIVELHAQCWTWPYLAMIKIPSNNSWIQTLIRITSQFNELFLVSLPSYPENFIKIR